MSSHLLAHFPIEIPKSSGKHFNFTNWVWSTVSRANPGFRNQKFWREKIFSSFQYFFRKNLSYYPLTIDNTMYCSACNTDISYCAFFNLFPLITPALSDSHFRASQDLLTCEILYKPDTSRLWLIALINLIASLSGSWLRQFAG